MTPVLKRVGAVVHPGRPAAVALGKELVRWAADHGVELRTLEQERGCLGSEVPCVGPDQFPLGLDLVVVLGGDGTLLRAVGLSLRAQVPVLGVNVGRLGFLTEVEPDGLADALEAVWEGRYRVERRSTLLVHSTVDGRLVGEDLAANDLVLDKGARERLVSVAVYVDGRFLARYAADGLIVASPTGSTAYSFSAGGPIVSPHLDAVLLTAVAPHMVFNRSLVLHPSEGLRLEVLPDSPVVESVDGRAVRELPPGAVIEVRRSDLDALLVRIGDADFYGLVRSKFRLADAPESGGAGHVSSVERSGEAPDD
ncbi:MAG TPA: NAD(+)/NADH kinase [Actinomycetota bacterium]|nr:NAD(+)/NADH kinase [Actinomycetota bacterium]